MTKALAWIDAVVVSYNSSDHLRNCVVALAAVPGVRVIVADNDSSDGSLDTISDLPVTVLALERNGGFAFGCNRGSEAGDAPFVLFMNPDARLDEASVRALARVLEEDEDVGIVGPRLLRDDGSLILSQRRFPTPASTFARALMLHRLLPRASWASEENPDVEAYDRPGAPGWISGACMLARRSVLEQIDGLDEGFFLYCEDKDLCRRIRDAGYDVRYEPGAVCMHTEGASAPRPRLLGILAASRVRYARKHGGRVAAGLERVGLALVALPRMIAAAADPARRAGHLAALLAASGRAPERPR
jgi:N-acetylglucosaminyl-diphospho-decaprenol L-rhamnosyltransferase